MNIHHTQSGLDVFLSDPKRRGKRYGLATHPAAVTTGGEPSWKAFMRAGLNLACLFGPEHGFRGASQDAVSIEDEVFMGIPAYSLYGKRLMPEPWMLKNLDALIFDMQDVGCRYYTFLYTLANIMKACIDSQLPLIVLDRPNPIGGLKIEGSPIKAEYESFVGGYGLPARYGMTIGEFAEYLRGEYFPSCDLEVVKLVGWSRSMKWQETGLPWPLTSPNLPSLSCAEVYPGTCLVEGTWLSEGRGTSRPFEIIGAPFIDGESLRSELARLALPGVVFLSLYFVPTISKFKDEQCQGILVSVIDDGEYRSLDTGIAITHTIKSMYPEKFQWREDWENPKISFFDKLAGGPSLRHMIDNGASLDDCISCVHSGEEDFLLRRSAYLLY